MTTKTDTAKQKRSKQKPGPIWHLVTNQQNMLYILAAGMVMSPAGFRAKHYSDALSVFPGWIPLFRDKIKIPADALHHATSERKHLLPCIASFDLSALSGPVQMLSRNGRRRNTALPSARKGKDDIAMLIRAPLPTTLLLSINFCTPEDKQAFVSAANAVSNIDLSAHRLEIAQPLFSSDTEVPWPVAPMAQTQTQLFANGNEDPFPAFGQAVGGVLAVLYHTANRSDLGLAVFRVITGSARDQDHELVQSDSVLAELGRWMSGGDMAGLADTRARLFWGVIQALVVAQMQVRPQAPIDTVLAYLEKQLDQLEEVEFRPRLERLIADMRGSLGLGTGTITELFERHKGSLSRPLLIFCLREYCTELLEFSHPLLSDAEYLLAGILFGVRDGWLQLPKALRDPDLSAYVAFRMANAEFGKQDNGLAMGAPPCPQPLRGLFTTPNGEWDSQQNNVAIALASQCNWHDCIQTRITLVQQGDLPNSFERTGLDLVLPGRVTVVEEVDEAQFLRRLGQWPPVASQIESEVRRKFE